MRFFRSPRRRWDAPPGRYFFVHIQKTAGTALLAQFREGFRPREIYPGRRDGDPIVDGPQFKTERLQQAWADRGSRIRLVIGHYPFCTVSLLPAEFRTMTLLREPVDRTISFLRHHRQLHPADADRTLAELYDDDRFRALTRNHMVLMLGMSAAEMTDGMFTRLDLGADHLAMAKVNLSTIDAFGVQENFDEYGRLINRKFGFRIQRTDRVNVSSGPNDGDDSELRARIRADNALDCELYRFAVAALTDDESPRDGP